MFKINSDRTKRLIPTIFKFVGSLVLLTTVLITSFLVSLEIVSSVKYIMMGRVEVELITPPKIQSQLTCMRETSLRLRSGLGFPSLCCQDHTTASAVLTVHTGQQTTLKINLSISHSLSRVTKPKVQKSFLKATCQTWFPQQLQKCSLANSKIIAGPPCMRISFKPFSKYLIHTQYFRPIDVTSRFSTNHNKIMGTLS